MWLVLSVIEPSGFAAGHRLRVDFLHHAMAVILVAEDIAVAMNYNVHISPKLLARAIEALVELIISAKEVKWNLAFFIKTNLIIFFTTFHLK